MTTLKTGDLRDRVTIERKTSTTDSQGGRSETWSTLATVPAQVVAAVPRESLQMTDAGSPQFYTAYTVAIRYRTDVTSAMRLSWTPYRGSAKTLQIQRGGVQPHQTQPREFLTITCSEVS